MGEPLDDELSDSISQDSTAAMEERLTEEENVLNYHLECVKQEAQLITVEGEIITTLEKAMVNNESYDMDNYLDTA